MSSALPKDPRPRVGAGWFSLFTVAWIVLWTAQLTPLQLLLPLQLDTSESESGWVRGVVASGLVLGIGGVAGVLAAPLSGALSDRSARSRARRRPWALAGTWIASVCLILTGMSSTPVAIGAAWVGVSIGTAVASAAFTALIADQLPFAQRGAASSAASSAQALGLIVGVATVVLFGLGVFTGYVVLAGALAVVGSLAAILLPDPPPDTGLAGPQARPRTSRMSASLRDRDFRLILIGRLIVNVGNALGTSLFLFFLLYGLGQPREQAEVSLLIVIVIYTVFVVAASVYAGLVSDRIGERRGLTVLAGFVQAASGLVLVAAPTFPATLVAAAVMGVGYGAFSAVGLAFATDRLPSAVDHARDLGIVNTVAALGQLIGPVAGALLVALVGGFWLLFAVAAVLSIAGALVTAAAK